MMIRRLSFSLKVFVAPSSWFGVGARVDLPLLLQQVLTPFPLAAHHKYCANTNTKQLQIQIMCLTLSLSLHNKYKRKANTNTRQLQKQISSSPSPAQCTAAKMGSCLKRDINYYQFHREMQLNGLTHRTIMNYHQSFDKRVRLHSSVVPRHVGRIF